MGEASLATEPWVTSLNCTAGSAAAFCSSAMIEAGLWPGKMRQLMLASACCGRGFKAWAPLIMVATRGGAIVAIMAGVGARVSIAALSAGLAAKAFIAAPVLGSSYFA